MVEHGVGQSSLTLPPGGPAGLEGVELSQWRVTRTQPTPTGVPLPLSFSTRMGSALPALPYLDDNTLGMHFGRRITATDASDPTCTYDSGVAGGLERFRIPPQSAGARMFAGVVEPSFGGPGTVKIGDSDSGVAFTTYRDGLSYGNPQIRVFLPQGLLATRRESLSPNWGPLVPRPDLGTTSLTCDDGRTRTFDVFSSDWIGIPRTWESRAGETRSFTGASFESFTVTPGQLANRDLFTRDGQGRPLFWFTVQAGVDVEDEFLLMGDPPPPTLTRA